MRRNERKGRSAPCSGKSTIRYERRHSCRHAVLRCPTKGFSIVSRKHPNRRPEGRGHADEPAGIDIVGLTKRYLTPKGETFTAIQDVTLAVEPGQFCSIVGPT